jgi:hypothetical protein
MQPETKPLDVAELKPCALCKRGMMHSGSPVFYELNFATCVVDLPNIQRMHGLETMMGGNVGVARAFSPSNNVAHRMPATRSMICSECAETRPILPLLLLEEEADAA